MLFKFKGGGKQWKPLLLISTHSPKTEHLWLSLYLIFNRIKLCSLGVTKTSVPLILATASLAMLVTSTADWGNYLNYTELSASLQTKAIYHTTSSLGELLIGSSKARDCDKKKCDYNLALVFIWPPQPIRLSFICIPLVR